MRWRLGKKEKERAAAQPAAAARAPAPQPGRPGGPKGPAVQQAAGRPAKGHSPQPGAAGQGAAARLLQPADKQPAAGPGPQRPAFGDMPRIEQIRRRKKARRLRRAALALSALVAVALYLGGVVSSSVNWLGDLVDSARIALLPGEGWPQETGLQGLAAAGPMSGGVALCGPWELQIYSSTARLLRSVQHGYAEPVMAVGDTRACIYNRGGRELRVESRSQTLLTKNTDYEIFTVGMAAGGTMAVATRTQQYLAQVTVYNTSFDPVYYAYLADSYPLQIALDSSGRRMAVGSVRAENGVLCGQLNLYDLTSDDPAQQRAIQLAGALPLQLRYTGSGQLTAVFDSFAAIYDLQTGAERARYDYGGEQLHSACISGRNLLLVFGDTSRAGASRCLLLGPQLQQLAALAPGFSVQAAALSGEYFYLLGRQEAVGYDLAGAEVCRLDLPGEGWGILAGKTALVVTAKEILQLIPLKRS